MNQHYRSVPWQRNLRKVPEPIRAKLPNLRGTSIAVGVTVSLPRTTIERGIYRHLGLLLADGQLSLEASPVIPPADMGRWSWTNIEGHEVIRRDVPMMRKTIYIDTPNWGDWSNGSHTVEWTRDVQTTSEHYLPLWGMKPTVLDQCNLLD